MLVSSKLVAPLASVNGVTTRVYPAISGYFKLAAASVNELSVSPVITPISCPRDLPSESTAVTVADCFEGVNNSNSVATESAVPSAVSVTYEVPSTKKLAKSKLAAISTALPLI